MAYYKEDREGWGPFIDIQGLSFENEVENKKGENDVFRMGWWQRNYIGWSSKKLMISLPNTSMRILRIIIILMVCKHGDAMKFDILTFPAAFLCVLLRNK